jgi:phosphohistidine phosphatase
MRRNLALWGDASRVPAVLTLFLMRHAKSSFREGNMPDHDRPLNARGRQAAPAMGQLLVARGASLDRVLTSSAVRALETAKAVCREINFSGPIDITSRLYLAEPEVYVDALADFGGDDKCVLVVGHNPGISDLLRRWTGHKEEMQAGAIAQLQLDVPNFREAKVSAKYKLIGYFPPPRESGGDGD